VNHAKNRLFLGRISCVGSGKRSTWPGRRSGSIRSGRTSRHVSGRESTTHEVCGWPLMSVSDARRMRPTFAPFAIALTLLAGVGLVENVSTVSAKPTNALVAPAIDVPTPASWIVDGNDRGGGQAARIELDDTPLNDGLSAWYRLAYLKGGSRLRVFEHYPATTLGFGSDVAVSERTSWRLANEVVGRYGASTASLNVPSWARVHTGNDTGGSAGLIFTLAYIDLLTPATFVGNLRVAGTGVVDFEGDVLPVSNVEVKVAAAILTRPDVVFTPTPSNLVDHTTTVESASNHTGNPTGSESVGEWLNVTGYETAGRDAASRPGTVAFVVVHDLRQALAWLCGRTNRELTCTIAHRAASLALDTQ
jgi:hypothetical protein